MQSEMLRKPLTSKFLERPKALHMHTAGRIAAARLSFHHNKENRLHQVIEQSMSGLLYKCKKK